MNNQVIDNVQSGRPIFDELQNMVLCVVGAMQADYAQQFNGSYKTDDDIRQLKRRLYAKLRGLDAQCVPDGYELCVQAKPNFLPTVPEIIAGVLQAIKAKKRRLQNKKEIEYAEAAYFPKSGHMPKSIRAAFDDAIRSAATDEATRQERLKVLSLDHEALIAEHERRGLIRKRVALLLCCRCGAPGVLSNSVRGDGNWCCAEHWRPS